MKGTGQIYVYSTVATLRKDYQSRISLKTLLMYNLRNYPWDEQTAIMQIASYGFQKHDIEYVWKETDPVQINKVTV